MFFHIYKNPSAKYYQDNKKRLQKKFVNINIFLKKKETKRISMTVSDTEIFQKMKNEG